MDVTRGLSVQAQQVWEYKKGERNGDLIVLKMLCVSQNNYQSFGLVCRHRGGLGLMRVDVVDVKNAHDD